MSGFDIERRAEGPSASLPSPIGALTDDVICLLSSPPGQPDGERSRAGPAGSLPTVIAAADPLGGDDFQLALYICFELSYRGFAGVDPAWESELALIERRLLLERAFLDALEIAVPAEPAVDPDRIGDRLFELERDDDGPSLSRFLETRGTIERFREFAMHRSAYQLKEADPHSWAIPRLDGPVKAALLEIQSDEYGGGRSERMHSRLFAKAMVGLGLDSTPNGYIDRLPGTTLATVNLMSALGMRRARRGACVGHLAMFEITSSRPNRAYGNGLRRLGAGPETTDFYDEHVEADAVHENIAAYDLAGGLARQEPALAADILFGARALLELDARFAGGLLGSWERGRSSLRGATDPSPVAA
ncbi:MAG TPA: iron-containing redox enzyme family protein [Solirubrobacterales bacterium]|nr:iron-containing redox enzyme family protein [Solirubrobacterales bacterium]